MTDVERTALKETVHFALGRAVSLMDPDRLSSWEDAGLTMSQLRVLWFLNHAPGMTAGKLAENLGVRPSTVTGIVDRLVRQHLVKRSSDPLDRRVVRNCLTADGARLITEFGQAERAFVAQILDQITDADLRLLACGLTTLREKAEAMGLLAHIEEGVPEPVSPA